ncbi:hypothetical protein [Litchfieldia salsa]|uniref:Secreted protein n=1 Tax=Litchfieldia salsa TaxID=930152 RepID=A0A1H0WP40_9BACI|nr:hypothetical protein [Litchfieldia salsa]SDP92418.1 hypothetical protein SAMN05216565_11311 [Litchfieldia salsa]
MKKWMTSAILYLVVVIAVYNLYGLITSSDQEGSDPAAEHSSHGEETAQHDHGDHHTESDVKAEVRASDNNINIYLTDQSGHPVEELEVNHEEVLHLIIVDEQLEQYYHLHPNQIDVGVFQASHELSAGTYIAFVDVLPAEQSYEVAPLHFTIGGEEKAHEHGNLTPDQEFIKVINGQSSILEMSSMNAGEPITLNFKLPNAVIEPYLGAMGHVVILDENGHNYLHVHPKNHEDLIFETFFDQPGIYKIWAEFQIAGEVLVFPYVVEIK